MDTDTQTVYANVVTNEHGFNFVLSDNGCLYVNAAHVVSALISIAEGFEPVDETTSATVAYIAQGMLETFDQGYRLARVDQCNTLADLENTNF